MKERLDISLTHCQFFILWQDSCRYIVRISILTDKSKLTLSTDRKSATEGEYIEIRSACDSCHINIKTIRAL